MTLQSLCRIVLTWSLLSSLLPAAGQTNLLKDEEIQRPDFIGLHAVTAGRTTELKAGADKVNEVAASTEFLLYALEPQTAHQVRLQRLPTAAETAAREKQVKRALDQRNQFQALQAGVEEHGARLRELTEGTVRGAQELELKLKPLKGETNMVRLIPAEALVPGDYLIGLNYLPLESQVRLHVTGAEVAASTPAPPPASLPATAVRDLYLAKAEPPAAGSGKVAPVDAEFIVPKEGSASVLLRITNRGGRRITLTGMNSIAADGKSLFSKLNRQIAAGSQHDFGVGAEHIKSDDTLEVYCEGYTQPAVFTTKRR